MFAVGKWPAVCELCPLETETGAWCESKVIRVRQARHGVLKETLAWGKGYGKIRWDIGVKILKKVAKKQRDKSPVIGRR